MQLAARVVLMMFTIALAACHSMTTELVGVDASASDEQVATVWADNTSHAYMEIRKADGKRTSSFWTDSTSPYSIKIAPGKHTLTVFFMDVAPNVPQTYPPITSVSTKLDVEVDLLPGHAYALRHEIALGGQHVRIYPVDLGTGKECRHVPTGGGMRGYAAVALDCQ